MGGPVSQFTLEQDRLIITLPSRKVAAMLGVDLQLIKNRRTTLRRSHRYPELMEAANVPREHPAVNEPFIAPPALAQLMAGR